MIHSVFTHYLQLALATTLLAASVSSLASESHRITTLEREVQELKQRLSKIESSQQTTPQAQVAPTDQGWRQLANWRSLKRGMSFEQVRATLGEPASVSGGIFTEWSYSNGGTVTFYQDKLHRWSEPR
jgi:hypothetical protein